MGKLICLSVGAGDASIIQTGNVTFLVDTHNIEDHSNFLPTNKNIRGVFITHQHTDHFSGLEYLYMNGYSIDWLIYSPYKRRNNDNSVTLEEWNSFSKWRDKFVAAGTKTMQPYRQSKWDTPFWETDGIKFEIIGPEKVVATSDTRELHDASLVVKAILGKRVCLFTGDASDKNLNSIATDLKNYCNDILHASHHGSINGCRFRFYKRLQRSVHNDFDQVWGLSECSSFNSSPSLSRKHFG